MNNRIIDYYFRTHLIFLDLDILLTMVVVVKKQHGGQVTALMA